MPMNIQISLVTEHLISYTSLSGDEAKLACEDLHSRDVICD